MHNGPQSSDDQTVASSTVYPQTKSVDGSDREPVQDFEPAQISNKTSGIKPGRQTNPQKLQTETKIVFILRWS